MLHQHDGQAEMFARAQDQVGQDLGLAHVQACGGLVEQQQPGPRSQGPGQLQQALLAKGQVARLVLGQLEQAHEVEHLQRLVLDGLFHGPGGAGAQQAVPGRNAQPGVAAGHDVLQKRHVGEYLQVLEGAHQAQAAALVGLGAGDVVGAEAEGSLLGRDHAGHGVDQRGLARAVGADDRRDLVLPGGQVHAGKGLQPAEAHAHVRADKQRL